MLLTAACVGGNARVRVSERALPNFASLASGLPVTNRGGPTFRPSALLLVPDLPENHDRRPLTLVDRFDEVPLGHVKLHGTTDDQLLAYDGDG